MQIIVNVFENKIQQQLKKKKSFYGILYLNVHLK